jgi:RNA polymerase sigma-70 factor (ECF subfamily)
MANPQDERQAMAEITRLLIRHRHGILAYLFSLLHNHHAVEDVFQEVSIIAIQKAHEFQLGTNFVAWVLAIARNKVREHLRARLGITIEESLLEQMQAAFDAVDVDLERRKSALRQCLTSLEEKTRRFLELRYQENMSPAAIAMETQQTRSAINSILQRLREKLRACVERRLLTTEN